MSICRDAGISLRRVHFTRLQALARLARGRRASRFTPHAAIAGK